MKTNPDLSKVNRQLSALLDYSNVDQSSAQLLPLLQEYLQISRQYLHDSFVLGVNIRQLVHARSRHIDKLLVALSKHLELTSTVALIAVGGYGRGELHPQSDIDLLALCETSLQPEQARALENLISMLWDCQLKVSQSVRTLKQCVKMAGDDVTIATNLMESRLLAGPEPLFAELKRRTAPNKVWNAKAFFEAKTAEQRARYKKYDGSSFDLEPNVKSSPGGLRDMHVVRWIAQRSFYPKSLSELVSQNVITKKEYYSLVKCQLYIWRVRFALHLVSGKPEDRLLFDYQKSAATLMGYKNTQHTLAVEKMMKRYYRSALIVRNICDILFLVLEENLTRETEKAKPIVIDDYFQIVNQRIDAVDRQLFTKDPSQLLRVFQYVAKDDSLKGITARTLRAIRAARYKINSTFRNKKNNKQLFVDFWHILHTSSRAMFLMKRSGVLADYLCAFSQITGQMQYDMFHIYTVDEHTLFLLKNLSEFADPEHSADFPICSEIMQRQKNPEIIFLAGLFHDIAKGRGGDHSELGAAEVREFGKQHNLNPQHTDLIEWLVGNHLIMSLIAQKRDISDPKVIQSFAQIVQDQKRLELLYILTVADIRATSHSLWNSWKDSLLRNLYISTSAYLSEDNDTTHSFWKNTRDKAKQLLIDEGFDTETIENLWQYLDKHYFNKRSIDLIVWQTKQILIQRHTQETVVGIRPTAQESGSEVFVYSPDKENLFAALAVTLSQQGLSIQAANIYTDKNGYCYDNFIVLDAMGRALTDAKNEERIKRAINSNLHVDNHLELSVQRRMPRQFKYFSIPTKVEFFDDEFTGFTRMEVTARDQAGLLAAVGKAFVHTNTRLHEARITTLGEKVEDIFIISHRDNSAITDQEILESIRHEIKHQLEQ